MPNTSSHRGQRLLAIAITLLLTADGKASPVPLFFQSSAGGGHILRNFPLYNRYIVLADTALTTDRRVASGFIHRERNGDLVIMIPNAVHEKYRIRFFDADNSFLFEVRQIRDPLLIVEKYNFQHAGLFQYELYRDNQLVERSTFLIRKD